MYEGVKARDVPWNILWFVGTLQFLCLLGEPTSSTTSISSATATTTNTTNTSTSTTTIRLLSKVLVSSSTLHSHFTCWFRRSMCLCQQDDPPLDEGVDEREGVPNA